MHRPEDVDIVYKAAPRVQGWRERTGEKFGAYPSSRPSQLSRPPLTGYYSHDPRAWQKRTWPASTRSPTMFMNCLHWGKGSNGCMLFAAIQPKTHGSKQSEQATLLGGHSSLSKTYIGIILRRTRHQWAASMLNVRSNARRERSSNLSLCPQRRRRN